MLDPETTDPTTFALDQARGENARMYRGIEELGLALNKANEENARLRALLAGCADALTEAGKDFALASPRAVRPNLYELHAEAARAALSTQDGAK